MAERPTQLLNADAGAKRTVWISEAELACCRDEIAQAKRLNEPPTLQKLAADAPIERIVAALWRDGGVVIERAVSKACADECIAEMAPYVEEVGFGDGFLGRQTKRVGAVVARSPASWHMVMHPVLMRVCEAVLGRQMLNMSEEDLEAVMHSQARPARVPWQCHLHQIIQIGAGNRAQPIHQDAGAFLMDFKGQVDLEISTMWALDDFSVENGATRVVPGSHRWDKAQKPRKDAPNADQAVMPAGSVLIYLGRTFHSGGQNRSAKPRWGLNIDYNLVSDCECSGTARL